MFNLIILREFSLIIIFSRSEWCVMISEVVVNLSGILIDLIQVEKRKLGSKKNLMII